MKQIIAYTSDVHGNELQYQKLIDYALQNRVNSVIIGGDVLPKNLSGEKFIAGQRAFLEQKLLKMIDSLKTENISTFFLLGNDDAAANVDLIENLPTYIHTRRRKLNEHFDVCGYSYVPITPFGIKDWEKYDLSTVHPSLESYYEQRKRTNYRLEGFKTTTGKKVAFRFESQMEQNESIQRDLENPVFTQNQRKTIYVIHTPPDYTSLDQLYSGEHVGSIAVRLFIQKNKHYITLHGHIHETVEVSGTFKEKIGDTFSFSSGNDNNSKRLALILFDLDNPDEAKRVVL